MERFWEFVRDSIKRIGRWIYRVPYLHGVLSTTGKTASGFWKDDCFIMAAAISFYAVLSLIPFVLLTFSVTGYVLGNLGDGFAKEELFGRIAEFVRVAVPFTSEEFMQRLKGMTLNRETYGLTGLTILFITSGLVFRSLELAFARVFKTNRHRSMLAHQLLFVIFIVGLGLVAFALHHLSVVTSSVASGLNESFAVDFRALMKKFAWLRFLANVVVGTLVFTFLLKYFSRQKVRLRSSLCGGFLFACLWMMASYLFALYLTHVARFSLLYGSFASMAVIVVWTFYSACVLLLCAEFASVLQHNYWPFAEPQSSQR